MKMKKLLSLVVASSMVVSSFSMSFAAQVTPGATAKLVENVEDVNVTKAVQRLNAFGIVDGMADGEYHAEKMVTRQELAKLVVEALGLGDAVPAAKGTTVFKDVDINGWAVGYINVAYGQGIIKGDGNGNFNPTAEVSYASAITMLVRALGYKDQFLNDKGTWPSNYIAKAADLDITDDVTYAETSANRGDVAIMLNNTLDANIIDAVEYGRNIVQGSNDDTTYKETGETLLENKLGIDKVEDLRITRTPSLSKKLDEDEVTLKALKEDVVIDDKDLKENHEKDFDTKVATDYLLGEEVSAYFDGDEMVYVESETDQDNVFRAAIQDDDDEKADDMVIEGSDDKYGWADDAIVYINNEDVSEDDYGDFSKKEKIAYEDKNFKSDYVFARKLIVENGDIVFLDAANFEDYSADYISLAVNSVNVDKESINVFETYTGKDDDRDVKLDDYDYYDIFTEGGIKLGLEDLQENDLIYMMEEQEDEDRAHVIVADDRAVIGDLDDYQQGYGNKGKDRSSVKIDGESYDLADKFTFTDDDMDTIEDYKSNEDKAKKDDDKAHDVLYDKLEDIFGEEVSVLRDFRNNIAFINSSVDASIDQYAVVLGSDDKYGDTELKIWNVEGTVAFYEFDDDKLPKEVIDMRTDLKYGTIIKYDLNSAGTKIKVLEAYTVNSDGNIVSAYVYEDDIDVDGLSVAKTLAAYSDDSKAVVTLDTKDTFEDDAIKIDNAKKVYNVSDSVYINYADYFIAKDNDDDDLEVIAWDELDGDDASYESKALVLTDEDNNDVELMVFINDNNIADSDIYEGYVAKITRSKDTKTVDIDVVGEGMKTYVLDDSDDAYDIIVNETPIVFTEKGKSIKLITDDKSKTSDKWSTEKYTMVNEKFSKSEANIYDVDGRYITLTNKDGARYKLAADVVIYNEEDAKDKGDLVADKDKTIYVRFISQGGEILALQYDDFKGKATDDENSDVATDGTITYIATDGSKADIGTESVDIVGDLKIFFDEDENSSQLLGTKISLVTNNADEAYKIKTIELEAKEYSQPFVQALAKVKGITIAGQGTDKTAAKAGDINVTKNDVTITNIKINGNLIVDADDFTSKHNHITGDVIVNGDNASFNTEIDGDVTVSTTAQKATFSNVKVKGNFDVQGEATVTVSGATTVEGTITVANTATIDASEASDEKVKTEAEKAEKAIEAEALKVAKTEFTTLNATVTTSASLDFTIKIDDKVISYSEVASGTEANIVEKDQGFATSEQATAIKTAHDKTIADDADADAVKALTKALQDAIDAVKNQIGTK